MPAMLAKASMLHLCMGRSWMALRAFAMRGSDKPPNQPDVEPRWIQLRRVRMTTRSIKRETIRAAPG